MKKSEKYAYIGTVISGIIILLLLLFIFLPGLKMEEEGGVMISFGEAFDGGGSTEVPKQQVQQKSAPKPEVKEELITQKDKSVAIPSTPTKKKVDNTQSKAEERIKKEQQVTKQADDLIGGSFGASNNTGSGNVVGDKTQGNPAGSGTAGGNDWSLNGRDLLGQMPSPNYTQNVEGRITVDIRVDASGSVISASVGKNTNISDSALRNSALSAARRTRFSSGSGTVAGTITYNFKLK